MLQPDPSYPRLELLITPETYRLVAEGHCGRCSADLRPDPLRDAENRPRTLRGATCAECDLWWRSGTASNDHRSLFVEVCIASAWEAGEACGLDGRWFDRCQVEQYRGARAE